MRALVKASLTQAHVRPLALSAAVQGSEPAPPASPWETELAAAREEIATLGKLLAEAEARETSRVAAALEEGLSQGRAAAGSDEGRRTEMLEKGIAAACEELNDRLESLERLAPLLAGAALEKLFEPSGDLADRVARTIARTTTSLKGETVLTIRVSAADFPDGNALEALSARVRPGAATVIAEADLPSGECRMDLSLGHIDIGLAGQWRELRTMLDRLADGQAER